MGTGHKTLGKNATGAALERERQKETGVAPVMAVAWTEDLERHVEAAGKTRSTGRGRSEAAGSACGGATAHPRVDEGAVGMRLPLKQTEPRVWKTEKKIRCATQNPSVGENRNV